MTQEVLNPKMQEYLKTALVSGIIAFLAALLQELQKSALK